VTTTRRDRFRGALVGALAGDALGARFEGHGGPVPRPLLDQHLDATTPVTYTDDSAMTIAVAESLLASGGLVEDHLAATFAAHHQRDPDRGYGAGTDALLRRLSGGADWRQAATAQFGGAGSFGNGAAMRSAPFGLIAPEPNNAAILASRAAVVTHTHPHAVDGAAVQAAAVSYALHRWDEPAADVGDLLAVLRGVARTPEMIDQLQLAQALAAAPAAEVASRLGTSLAAIDAVPAAICTVLHHPDSYVDTVSFALELGGDTDTIAAMAGAISGALLGRSAIPDAWLQRVEGVELMQDLADRLDEQTSPNGGTDAARSQKADP
jgi:poly(ADP-ribose) glycohydrolase ARH3